jgi:hypothetical protein
MAYIGTDINYGNIASQTGTGDGTTTPIATLTYSVPTSSSIIVTLDGVTQVPTTDYVATGTTLTFTSSVASPIAILVVFLGRSLDIGTPADNTVDSAQLVNGSVDLAHMSAESVDSDQYVDGSIDNAHLADDAVGVAELSATGTASSSTFLRGDNSWAAAGGGKVLQVLQDTLTSTASTTSTSFVDVTGLSVSITPSATSSKILVFANISIGNTGGYSGRATLVRDSTEIFRHDTGSSGSPLRCTWQPIVTGDQIESYSTTFLDPNTPADTSTAITYKIQYSIEGGGTLYVNRSVTDNTAVHRGRGVSSITVMEIGA